MCSAAVTTLDSRSVRHDDAALGRRLDVHVVDADARPPDRSQAPGAGDQLGGELGGRADHDAVVLCDALGELLGAPVHPDVHVEVLAQQRHPGVADLLLDEDLGALPGLALLARGVRRRGAHRVVLSSTQSMHAVRACTSEVSTAGNIPIRSWFRPSLR